MGLEDLVEKMIVYGHYLNSWQGNLFPMDHILKQALKTFSHMDQFQKSYEKNYIQSPVGFFCPKWSTKLKNMVISQSPTGHLAT